MYKVEFYEDKNGNSKFPITFMSLIKNLKLTKMHE